MIIIPYHVTPEFISKNPYLWIYSTSMDGRSFSGQCAVGNLFPTKCFPVFTKRDWCESSEDCWWHDSQFATVKPIIDDCFDRIPDGKIVFPFHSIGMGCSQLAVKAPALLAYIRSRIEKIAYKDYNILTPDGRLICPLL
jgi:hypothetical protein